MHNSARMLFSRFHFLVYGERKLRAWNRIRDVALCTLRSQNLCCRTFVKISLWAFESLGTKGPDLLIADNQCTVIAANYTTIVSSEKFNDIRIWYKYDMEIAHFDCGASFGMALKTKSTDAKFSWNCLDDHWPWWNRGGSSHFVPLSAKCSNDYKRWWNLYFEKADCYNHPTPTQRLFTW